MNILNPIIIIISMICLILWLTPCIDKIESFECNNQSAADSQMAEMGETAAEACSRISTEAENIKAAANGTANVIDSLWGALSPNNYSSGDNETEDIVTNIINTNLSECDILKIQNDCSNAVASSQSNVIDNTNCPACSDPAIIAINPNICSISDVTQINQAEISQTCTIQSAIETLLQKTNSVESQALADVLMESSGLLSGDNSYTSDNCTLLNTDMSSAEYVENRSSCSNEIAVSQENTLSNCGPVTGVLQQNQFTGLQSCLIQSEVETESQVESKTIVQSELIAELISTGLTWESSVLSSVLFAIIMLAGIIGSIILGKDENIQKIVADNMNRRY